MTPPPLRLVVSLLALLTAGANPAPAADLPPEAASVLRAAAEAYKALPAYADRGKVVVTISAGGREERRTTAMTLEFVRPNRLVFDAGVLALLLQQPLAIGQLGEAMGISRQAARQMADGLVERGYATFGTDDADARRTLVVLAKRESVIRQAWSPHRGGPPVPAPPPYRGAR